MEAYPPARENLPWQWRRPERTEPPGLSPEQAWAWAMDNFPALCRPSSALRLVAMEAHPPAREDLPWQWRRPERTESPGLSAEQAWAWAMDNFPALCRPSSAPGLVEMEAHPPAREDLPWQWRRPERTEPPGLSAEQAWAWAMDNFPALCRPSSAPGLVAMEAHPPAREDLPRQWDRPEPSEPPGLNAEEAWAWAMDNFPALCRPSSAPGLVEMEAHPPAREDLPRQWDRPEPSEPPGLNAEQAWAWAMDNFPALCRPSSAPRHALDESSRGGHGLLRRPCTWPVDVPGAQRGQKRCQDPWDHHPKAESAEDPQPPQGDASTTSEGHTDAPGGTLSPSPPRKRLKTQA